MRSLIGRGYGVMLVRDEPMAILSWRKDKAEERG